MTFYLLMLDSNRDDLECVEDYEMGDFDLTVFWSGNWFEGSIPDSVTITLSEGDPSDYLGNPLSWKMLSPDFIKLIGPFIDEKIQLIPIAMYKNGIKIDRYTLMNPLGCIDAIASEGKRRKEKISIGQLKLDGKSIPPGRHIFRLCHQLNRIVISQAVIDAISGHGLNGIAVKKLPSV